MISNGPPLNAIDSLTPRNSTKYCCLILNGFLNIFWGTYSMITIWSPRFVLLKRIVFQLNVVHGKKRMPPLPRTSLPLPPRSPFCLPTSYQSHDCKSQVRRPSLIPDRKLSHFWCFLAKLLVSEVVQTWSHFGLVPNWASSLRINSIYCTGSYSRWAAMDTPYFRVSLPHWGCVTSDSKLVYIFTERVVYVYKCCSYMCVCDVSRRV